MRTAVALINFSGNQKAVCAKPSGWAVQFMDEVAGSPGGLDGVGEIAYKMTKILHLKNLSKSTARTLRAVIA